MKNKKMKAKIYVLIVFIAAGIFAACKKMDGTYIKYVVPNGIVYPGKATDPQIHSGDNRVQISWGRGTDPKVVKARIFWNNFTDSVEFSVPADGDIVSYTIPNLPENFYSFTIKTYDKFGNVSVPVEISGNVLGDRFRATLLNRPLIASVLNKANKLTLQFDKADVTSTKMVAVEVEYTNTANELKVVRLLPEDFNLVITDRKPGTTYRYRTLHLYNAIGLDTFATSYVVVDALNPDKTELTIAGYSSYNTGDTPVGFSAPANLLDGNQNSRWLSLTTLSYPHYATIDLGVQRVIKTISLWRWTIAPTTAVPVPIPDERGPDVVKFQGSVDNVNWIDLGSNFNFNRLTSSEQKFTIPGLPQVRYIKINAISGPQKFVILGEFNAGLL